MLGALLLALALRPTPARAEGDVRDEVVRQLALRSLRADLVVLLDTSGSMAKHFDTARDFVADLARTARPDDTITFIAFADRASELMPPVTVRAGGADALRARLRALHPPRGRYTDLGSGLEAALDAVLRPGYAPLTMVFLITDFCAEPPPRSPHAGEREGAGPCRHVKRTEALQKKAARLAGASDQAVRSFALALEPTSRAGIGAARAALGTLETVDVAGGDLARAMELLRHRLEYDRAALAVEQLLKHPPLEVIAPDAPVPLQGARDLSFGVSSGAPLTMTVRVQGFRSLDPELQVALTGPPPVLQIPPSAAETSVVELPARVEARGRFTGLQRDPHRARRDGNPFEPVREIALELEVEVELSPAGPIEKLIGAVPRATTTVRQQLDLRFAPPAPGVAPIAVGLRRGAEALELRPGAEATVPLELATRTSWADLEVTCTVGGHRFAPVRLVPSSTGTLALPVRNGASPAPWRIAHVATRAEPLTGGCAVEAVAPDGTRLDRGQVPLEATVSLTWREGVSPWIVASALAGILLALALYFHGIKPRVAPAALAGRLVIHAGPGEFRRVSVSLRGRTRLGLAGTRAREGAVQLDGDRLVLPGLDGALAELYAEKVGSRSAMRLRRLESGPVLVNARPLGSEPVTLRRGRARFSIGEYQCRIE